MKQYRNFNDMYDDERFEVYDNLSAEWARSVGFEFAKLVMSHTGCDTLEELVDKFPEIDQSAMRQWLANDIVDDDMYRMATIGHMVGIELELRIAKHPRIEQYNELAKDTLNDKDRVLRRPEG